MPLAPALRLVDDALDELVVSTGSAASDADLLAVLTGCGNTARRVDQIQVCAVGSLVRRGVFAERGYKNPATALSDLLGCDWAEAKRLVVVAEQVCDRVALDGTVLPPRLSATAAVFAAGKCGMGHVEVIGQVLDSDEASRLTPDQRAGVEADLAAKAEIYSPRELKDHGRALVTALDQDGPEPDDPERTPINHLRMIRNRSKPGGTLKGRFDDAAMFDTIATTLDAMAKPVDADDHRDSHTRSAEALADVCGFVLNHADSSILSECGGRKPHLNVTISLDDLEQRANAAMLDFGGTLSPAALRMLACDAGVVPIVLNSAGQPLDIGRSSRTWTDPQRRAVTARDRGCAKCGRPPSWCEIHHIHEWEHGGGTSVDNGVMLCTTCHRMIHHSGWEVRMRDGLPELIPPAWIDHHRRPRQRARPHAAAG